MLPSLFTSDGNVRPWSVPRAALYGAGIGLAAALIKIFGPFHAADCASRRSGKSVLWFSPLGCFAPALHCCAICWRGGFRTRDAERPRSDRATSAVTLQAARPHGTGPRRLALRSADSACGCTPQDKVSSWDLGCDRPGQCPELGGLKKLRLPCRRFRPGGRDYLPTDFWRDAASSILSQRCRIGGESTFTAGGKN